MVVAALDREGEFEPEPLKAWGDACIVGGNFVDVGAYTGLYAIAAAAHDCKVIAFEPNPAVERRLCENIKHNRAKVKVFGCALSDAAGVRQLFMNGHVGLTSAGSLEERNNRNAETAVVCKRLDDILRPGTRVKAMKIDVEGHEQAVLTGAERVITDGHPMIIIELLTDDAVRAVGGWLTERGYQGRPLDLRNWLFTEREAG